MTPAPEDKVAFEALVKLAGVSSSQGSMRGVIDACFALYELGRGRGQREGGRQATVLLSNKSAA